MHRHLLCAMLGSCICVVSQAHRRPPKIWEGCSERAAAAHTVLVHDGGTVTTTYLRLHVIEPFGMVFRACRQCRDGIFFTLPRMHSASTLLALAVAETS